MDSEAEDSEADNSEAELFVDSEAEDLEAENSEAEVFIDSEAVNSEAEADQSIVGSWSTSLRMRCEQTSQLTEDKAAAADTARPKATSSSVSSNRESDQIIPSGAEVRNRVVQKNLPFTLNLATSVSYCMQI